MSVLAIVTGAPKERRRRGWSGGRTSLQLEQRVNTLPYPISCDEWREGEREGGGGGKREGVREGGREGGGEREGVREGGRIATALK